jgi:cation diffusion facilitator family transporter
MQASASRIGIICGWVSVLGNILIFVFKYWYGMKLDSVSMRAEAFHTLSDSLTSLVVIAGLWIAHLKPDLQHPFGHGRAESLAAVIVGTLLGVVGMTFMQQSVLRLHEVQGMTFSLAAVLVFGVSVVLKEAMAQYAFYIGRKIKSTALIADGWHHRSDGIASGIVAAGILAGRTWWWVDGVLGIVVSLLIFYTAYDIIRHSSSMLLGEEGDQATLEHIRSVVCAAVPKLDGIHHVHVHTYGDHTECTFHIRQAGSMTLKESHARAEAAEQALRRELDIEATVHVDPLEEAPTAAVTRDSRPGHP